MIQVQVNKATAKDELMEITFLIKSFKRSK